MHPAFAAALIFFTDTPPLGNVLRMVYSKASDLESSLLHIVEYRLWRDEYGKQSPLVLRCPSCPKVNSLHGFTIQT